MEDARIEKKIKRKYPGIVKSFISGYKDLESGSILAYYVTQKYDPTDEYRVEVGFFGENWKTKNK